MKLAINKKRLNLNPDNFLRKVGYTFIHDSVTGHDSYVHRLARDHYPRFHIYFQDLPDRIVFDLHFDQKQASYAGSHMHSAEYDGDTVAAEIERLKGFLVQESRAEGLSIDKPEETSDTTLADIGHGDFRDATAIPKKKGFWGKIFGG